MNPVSDTVLDRLKRLHESVVRVIRGKAEIVDALIAALLARGHVLLEDVPGVGKTTLAQALARSLDLDFHRIQFTSDTLPSDIIGISVYRQERGEFEFIEGPLFANVVLADEINRAAPRTQSALLEAMSEHSVTVEKTRHRLAEPFFVVATQNPVESTGTYPLPESQLDRFLMRLSMGYPGHDEELELLRSSGAEPQLEQLQPVLDAARGYRDAEPGARGPRLGYPARLSVWRWSRRPAPTRRSPSASLPVVVWHGSGRRRPSPWCAGARSCCPTISRTRPRRCSPTGCCIRTRWSGMAGSAVAPSAQSSAPSWRPSRFPDE